MSRLVVLHGANLDLLGERPAVHYGTITLPELERMVEAEAERLGWDCLCLQTNHEGCFIEYLHDHRRADAMIVNPGAWTHYSYAIRDALELVVCPVAEVHLSDISTREEWRRHSVISPVATFTVGGKGPEGYLEAVRRLVEMGGG
jgi:3-dehydroquinate dehydratase II